MSYLRNQTYGASPEIQRRAWALRKRMTQAEKILWEELRNRERYIYKFRRQHPIYKYIVDFYCHQLKLVIEADGEIHNSQNAREYDYNRTMELEERGLIVIRFTNKDIIGDLSRVVKVIKDKIREIEEG